MKASGLSSIFLGLGFISSLFFYGTDSPVFAFAAGFTLLSAAIILFSVLREGIHIPRDPIAVLVCAWGVYFCAVLPFATTPYLSALFTLVFLCAPVLFLSFALYGGGQAAARTGLIFMLAVIALMGVHALFQYLFFYAEYNGRARSVLLDPNTLAVLLNMLLMPLLAGFMAAQEERPRLFCAIASGLVFAALLATQSRGGLICTVAGLGVIAFILRAPGSGRRSAHLAAGMAGILVVFHILNIVLHKAGIIQVAALTITPGSVTDRLALWQSALAMTGDHLWTGTGLGTFSYFYGAYRLPADLSDGYFAHMDPLQMGVEAGMGATLIFYALVAAVIWRTVCALRASPAGSAVRTEIAATFAALITTVAHSHIYFHLYMPVVLLPLSCVLAVWYFAAVPASAMILTPGRMTQIVAAGVLTVALFLPLQWAARVGAGAYMIRHAAAAMYAGDFAKADVWVSRAEKTAPRDYFHVPQYRALIALSRLQSAGKNMPTDDRGVLIAQGMRDLAVVEKYNRTPAFTGLERSAFYGHAQDAGLMLDGYARAAGELRAVIIANPRNFAARNSLAALLLRMGDVAGAGQAIDEGLKWPPVPGADEIGFLVTLAEVRSRQGDADGAQDALRRAADKAQAYGLIRNQ